ncbi:MAG: hypothetical protein LBK98_05650, partial [Peptococcaceae bacterium]|nr:hypothetical protein [Peptococcaceae bacterium]
MYSKIMALTYGIENHPVFSSIKKGFMLTIPVIITGTVTLLIVNFPVAGLQNFLTEFGGGFIRQLLLFVYGSTVNFMSGYLLLSVSYYYSATFPEKNPLLRMLAMITALASFLASFGGPFGTLTLDSFGPVGVFTALVCAICAPRFFFFLSRWQPGRHRAYAPGSDLHYRSSMASILPVFICVFCFSMANLALRLFFQVGNFNELISNALIGMFRSVHNELANGLLFTLMLNLLWVFGIHGGNALDPVAKIIFAEQAGGNGLITKSFLDNFTVPGGCGATVCLLLALLLADRSRSNRELALSA